MIILKNGILQINFNIGVEITIIIIQKKKKEN